MHIQDEHAKLKKAVRLALIRSSIPDTGNIDARD